MAKLESLCVYCGSHVGADQAFRDAATELGALLARHRVRLVYGGGGIGLMGVVADAVLAAGGEAVGVISRHLYHLEVGHRGLAELHIVEGMHARKRKMFDLADAVAVLPGGLGTLDEAIEMVTWKQLGLHDKPIVLVDVNGYWSPLVNLVEHMIAHRFASPDSATLLTVVPSVRDIFPVIAAAAEPRLTVEHDEL